MAMTELEKLRTEVNLCNVQAARKANQLKVMELKEAIARIEKDIQVSLDKEQEIEQTLRDKG